MIAEHLGCGAPCLADLDLVLCCYAAYWEHWLLPVMRSSSYPQVLSQISTLKLSLKSVLKQLSLESRASEPQACLGNFDCFQLAGQQDPEVPAPVTMYKVAEPDVVQFLHGDPPLQPLYSPSQALP